MLQLPLVYVFNILRLRIIIWIPNDSHICHSSFNIQFFIIYSTTENLSIAPNIISQINFWLSCI
ncbi:hypothetical protein PRtIB026_A02710 [Pseudomonas sp. RtIB026]|nr:hypothetical protein PRtIB026_A02710 [Pseudomonas sp. RtIB026]